ncbi:hypothetical protein Ocepr_2377 (plasmid) [Oceanithermus profundus DSM 14977]|uniref:Uncharacterized protein n=1 Tax=Oceanithermus profundus (strain DSM 14977 / NBRC 100410 / VKM B-2274 / 506) TaxID=670487 RepID=E4UAP6_OCEP5|nr:hypothetical protein [Oceanithermus profundus]ADR37825.1 hypothetical protein Ocepr_2377 [Oceanithermus profundus DSM 14977]
MKRYVFGFLVFSVLTALLLAGCGGTAGVDGGTGGTDGSSVTPPPVEVPTVSMNDVELQAFLGERLVEITVGQAGLILTAASGAHAYTDLGIDVATAGIVEALGFDLAALGQDGCTVDVLLEGDQDGDGLPFRGYELSCGGTSGAYGYAVTGAIDSGDRWDSDPADTGFWVVPSALSPAPLQVTMADSNTLGRVVSAVTVPYLAAPSAPTASFGYTAYGVLMAGFLGTDSQTKVVGIAPDSAYGNFDTDHFRYDADDPQDPWLGGTVTPLPDVLYKWTYGTDGSTPLQIDFHMEAVPGDPLHWSRACASSQGRYGFDSGGVHFVATDGTLLATAQFAGCGRPAVTLY